MSLPETTVANYLDVHCFGSGCDQIGIPQCELDKAIIGKS